MKKNLQKLVSVVLSLVLVLSLTACGSSSSDVTEDGKTVLSIYTQYSADDETIPYDYAVAAVAEKFPDVELKLIVEAQDDSLTLKTLAATGQLPDIFRATSDVITTFQETNQIMVLNDVADATGYTDLLMDSAKSIAYEDNGNMYAYTYAGSEYVTLYYNKALFEQYGLEVPTTFDELIACADVFNANGITPISLFAAEGWNTVAMFDIVATSFNADGIVALDNGTASISDADYVSALEALEELVAAGVFSPDATTTNYDQASQSFLSGEAAMFVNGSWYSLDAEAALGDDVDWMYYPASSESAYSDSMMSFAGGASMLGFAVNNDSANAELAAEVASYFTIKYCEAMAIYRSKPIPLDLEVESESPLPNGTVKYNEIASDIESGTTYTWGLTNSALSNALQTYMQGLISGQYTTQEVIDEIEAALARA